MGFITKKTYYNLEKTLSMPGVSLFYCIICGIGLIVMYLIMPETEDRSLEDIELHFADNSKMLTDRHIPKLNHSNDSKTDVKNYLETNKTEIGFVNTAFMNDNSKV